MAFADLPGAPGNIVSVPVDQVFGSPGGGGANGAPLPLKGGPIPAGTNFQNILGNAQGGGQVFAGGPGGLGSVQQHMQPTQFPIARPSESMVNDLGLGQKFGLPSGAPGAPRNAAGPQVQGTNPGIGRPPGPGTY